MCSAPNKCTAALVLPALPPCRSPLTCSRCARCFRGPRLHREPIPPAQWIAVLVAYAAGRELVPALQAERVGAASHSVECRAPGHAAGREPIVTGDHGTGRSVNFAFPVIQM